MNRKGRRRLSWWGRVTATAGPIKTREIPTISILMKPLFRTYLTGEDRKWLKQSSTQATGQSTEEIQVRNLSQKIFFLCQWKEPDGGIQLIKLLVLPWYGYTTETSLFFPAGLLARLIGVLVLFETCHSVYHDITWKERYRTLCKCWTPSAKSCKGINLFCFKIHFQKTGC